MNSAILKQKEYLKTLAGDIRRLKYLIKERHASERPDSLKHPYTIQEEMYRKSREYRHRHIAACILRGTAREAIERPAECNLPSESLIQQFIDEYTAQRAEAAA